jgi:CRISPR-associated endonuclease/helicase Cas3
LRPGDLIVVAATYGGCDEWGWAPDSRELVHDLAEGAAQPYARRRFAVRVTPDLICQYLADADATPPIEMVRARLSDTLAEHSEDRPTELISAVLRMGSLPDSLKEWLEKIRDRCKGRLECEFPYEPDHQGSPSGVVFIARHGLRRDEGTDDDLAAVPATESDELGSAVGNAQLLDEHSQQVQDYARRFATGAGLSSDIVDDMALAAYLHDVGKLDPRFQAYLSGGNPLGYDDRQVLAKSGRPSLPRARERAGLPEQWRHEALSVRLAQLHPRFAQSHDPALVLWLIGVHHGLGRPLFPHADPMDAKARTDLPAALGVSWRLDAGHGPQSLAFDFEGRDWAQNFLDLKDHYGIWGLARLEAMLRLADHRASEEVTGRGEHIKPRAQVKPPAPVENAPCRHRLEGLEPDNLLAFLALLGLMRTLETARPHWQPRAAWDVECPPLRPVLSLMEEADRGSAEGPQLQPPLCAREVEGGTGGRGP